MRGFGEARGKARALASARCPVRILFLVLEPAHLPARLEVLE